MKRSYYLYRGGEVNLGSYVYLPEDFDASRKYPMVVFLHGAGERGDGSEQMLPLVCKNALPKYAEEGKEYPFILLCPQCPENIVWNNIVLSLKKLIDQIALEYNADAERIYCTGISMGGYGTWEMGIIYSDFFAAVAPVCGGGFVWRASQLKNMPVWAFHGDADNVVPLENSRMMVDGVNAAGGNAKFTVFPGVQHNSWDSAYLETDVIEWLLEQKR
ncbi:MAG: dienelactone hydrolase family protein [Clostridia bacterium]|nr:dienelactone hydrolase family protein [Clostridia bacterium]